MLKNTFLATSIFAQKSEKIHKIRGLSSYHELNELHECFWSTKSTVEREKFKDCKFPTCPRMRVVTNGHEWLHELPIIFSTIERGFN